MSRSTTTVASTSPIPRTLREADDLYGELKKILNHTGMAQHHVLDKNFYMKMNIPVAGVAHQAGTCRFGSDPGESVLDRDCKAHEVDNLYVVDTSFFPSIGAVNPALTAIANAIRVGEHLTARLGDRGAPAPNGRPSPVRGRSGGGRVCRCVRVPIVGRLPGHATSREGGQHESCSIVGPAGISRAGRVCRGGCGGTVRRLCHLH